MARKQKPSGSIAIRKTNTRELNKLVLVVCEDEKSGCDYLKLMTKHYRLHTTCIVESSAKGAAPISIVDDAIARSKQQREDKKEPYELIFCIWDIDEHKSIYKARQKARDNGFNIVESNPCFEFWLLLHFVYHRTPITRRGRKSPADECESLLKKYINYNKSTIKEIFTDLLKLLDTAKKNAHKVRKDVENTGANNPSTDLDQLIHKMQNNFESKK